MAIYVTNSGEIEMLKSMLVSQAWRLGLYKNNISPDGNLIFSQITGLTVEGGYTVKEIANALVAALAADKWYVTTNSAGKAEATYSNAVLEWTFTQDNVDNAETAYGIYVWTLLLGFNTGSGEIRVGDTVTGLTSGATGIVTSVRLLSGTWAGTAAGYLCIKTQTGEFQAAENLQVGGVTKAKADGPSEKQLLFVEQFATAQVIDTVGQKIKYTLKVTLSTQ